MIDYINIAFLILDNALNNYATFMVDNRNIAFNFVILNNISCYYKYVFQ